jgi:hypothetical protein
MQTCLVASLSFGIGALSFGIGALSFGIGALSFGIGAPGLFNISLTPPAIRAVERQIRALQAEANLQQRANPTLHLWDRLQPVVTA